MRNLSIQLKLSGIIGALLALLCGIGVFTVLRLNVLERDAHEISTSWLPSMTAVSKTSRTMSAMRRNELRLISSPTTELIAAGVADVQRTSSEVEASLVVYRSLVINDEDRRLLAETERAYEAYKHLSLRVIDLMKSEKFEAARTLCIGEEFDAYKAAERAAMAQVMFNEVGGTKAAQRAADVVVAVRRAIVVVLGVSLAVGLVLGLAFWRNLLASLYGIQDAAEQVRRAAEEVEATSRDLASVAQEQAQAIEEITSSVEETDSQVRTNTESAATANQLVVGTAEAVTLGREKMAVMMDSMAAIRTASQSIGKIIKVIDEIAFQTNLLALNAAVEAARAGQHGRGFAVVAQEVRTLAGRSAKAARETAELIEGTATRVNDGVRVAEDTRAALDTIVSGVLKVKGLVAEIAAASSEQSKGMAQVSTAIGQVSSSTQSASQQAEELSSAAATMASAAERVRFEIAAFRLPSRTTAITNGPPPEVVEQVREMLESRKSHAGTTTHTTSSHAHALGHAPPGKRLARSPRDVLPLDHDERGYGEF